MKVMADMVDLQQCALSFEVTGRADLATRSTPEHLDLGNFNAHSTVGAVLDHILVRLRACGLWTESEILHSYQGWHFEHDTCPTLKENRAFVLIQFAAQSVARLEIFEDDVLEPQRQRQRVV